MEGRVAAQGGQADFPEYADLIVVTLEVHCLARMAH